MAHKLAEHLYKEVFVVGPDDNTAISSTKEISVFPNFEELIGHMKNLSVINDSDQRILHGYLTPADALPSNLRDKSIFILTTDELDDSEAAIIDVDSAINVEDLAKEVKDVVKAGLGITFTTDIDSTFLLYGYEINKILAPDDDDMDEEALLACKKISEEVEKIRTRNEGQLSKNGESTNGESTFTPEGL